MILFKKIPMEHKGQAYEIRVLYDDRIINVAAFSENHPADGYRYQVQLPKNCDPLQILEQYPVNELVEACERHVAEQHWETLSKVISECKKEDRVN